MGDIQKVLEKIDSLSTDNFNQSGAELLSPNEVAAVKQHVKNLQAKLKSLSDQQAILNACTTYFNSHVNEESQISYLFFKWQFLLQIISQCAQSNANIANILKQLSAIKEAACVKFHNKIIEIRDERVAINNFVANELRDLEERYNRILKVNPTDLEGHAELVADSEKLLSDINQILKKYPKMNKAYADSPAFYLSVKEKLHAFKENIFANIQNKIEAFNPGNPREIKSIDQLRIVGATARTIVTQCNNISPNLASAVVKINEFQQQAAARIKTLYENTYKFFFQEKNSHFQNYLDERAETFKTSDRVKSAFCFFTKPSREIYVEELAACFKRYIADPNTANDEKLSKMIERGLKFKKRMFGDQSQSLATKVAKFRDALEELRKGIANTASQVQSPRVA